jgi:hypothetical protein
MNEREYVIGADATYFTPPPDILKKSFLVSCGSCHRKVWVMVHNLEKRPICIECLRNVIREHPEGVHFGITPEDAREAARHFITSYLRSRVVA